MINLVTESGIIFISTLWYWFNKDRRRLLKNRIGRMGYHNVYRVARNIHYMIFNRSITVYNRNRIPKGGSILYSYHFGVWELMPKALASGHNKLGVIATRYQGNKLNRLLDWFLVHLRSLNNVQIFSVNDSWKIIKFLRGGGMLGVLVDGNDLYSRYEPAKRISKIARVPMIPFAAYRNNGSACLEIGCDLEKMISERPMDYMWFYRSRLTV